MYDKQFYNRDDVKKFKELAELIKITFQERGQRSTKKQLFSSKEKETWICECGKQCDIGANCTGCDKDIYGFGVKEVKPQEAIQSIEFSIGEVEEQLGKHHFAISN